MTKSEPFCAILMSDGTLSSTSACSNAESLPNPWTSLTPSLPNVHCVCWSVKRDGNGRERSKKRGISSLLFQTAQHKSPSVLFILFFDTAVHPCTRKVIHNYFVHNTCQLLVLPSVHDKDWRGVNNQLGRDENVATSCCTPRTSLPRHDMLWGLKQCINHAVTFTNLPDRTAVIIFLLLFNGEKERGGKGMNARNHTDRPLLGRENSLKLLGFLGG